MALTLSVDEAVQAQRWDDVPPLLDEREATLTRLEAAGAKFTSAELDQVQAVELRVTNGLRQVSLAVAASIRANVKSDAATRVYITAGTSRTLGFSQAS